jgi:acetyltransferase-like isoleucine patch superfamily enzyme
VGRYTYFGGDQQPRLAFQEADITIGSFCSISMNVVIFGGGNHRTDWVTSYPFPSFPWGVDALLGQDSYTNGPVIIGNDVWIGDGAVILSGVTVGDGAVIAASSVVSKDVRPYAIVAGNPAREVKRRFDDDVVEALLKIRWWDWDDEKIRRYAPMLCSQDVRGFIKATTNKEA